jgi:hypothetical protein
MFFFGCVCIKLSCLNFFMQIILVISYFWSCEGYIFFWSLSHNIVWAVIAQYVCYNHRTALKLFFCILYLCFWPMFPVWLMLCLHIGNGDCLLDLNGFLPFLHPFLFLNSCAKWSGVCHRKEVYCSMKQRKWEAMVLTAHKISLCVWSAISSVWLIFWFLYKTVL